MHGDWKRVFERVWRQLKSIGDALAWRAFGYDRRVIVALSRNASPGPMHGKDGLIKEREVIEPAWRDNGEFVLHHDLTAALRVGDLSVFRLNEVGGGRLTSPICPGWTLV